MHAVHGRGQEFVLGSYTPEARSSPSRVREENKVAAFKTKLDGQGRARREAARRQVRVESQFR